MTLPSLHDFRQTGRPVWCLTSQQEATMTPAPIDFTRTTSREPASESARPFRGRRLSWAEFFKERPDLRPANDNQECDVRPNS